MLFLSICFSEKHKGNFEDCVPFIYLSDKHGRAPPAVISFVQMASLWTLHSGAYNHTAALCVKAGL